MIKGQRQRMHENNFVAAGFDLMRKDVSARTGMRCMNKKQIFPLSIDRKSSPSVVSAGVQERIM